MPIEGAGREHWNDSQGQLTTGLKHSDFVHLRLGHVEHQLVISEEIPGGLRAQGHQGHVLQVWNGKVWPERLASETLPRPQNAHPAHRTPAPPTDHLYHVAWCFFLNALASI